MKVFLSVWLLLSGSVALAQTPTTKKPASAAVKLPGVSRITLLDQTVLQGRIVRRDNQKIYYTKPNDPTKRTYQQLLSRLDRITYADGRVETFRKPLVGSLSSDQGSSLPKPAPAAPTPPTAEVTPAPASSAAPPVAADSYVVTPAPPTPKTSRSFSRIQLTVGPEVAVFSQSNTVRWSNTLSGLGMNQNVGGSVRFDYRFIRAVALSVTGGYAQWKLTRNYLQNSAEKYDETIQITRIPIQAGIKLYPFGGLYVLPEGGVNLLMSSVKTSGAHPKPTDQQSNATPITYGASIGYEFGAGGLLIDLSGRYQVLDVQNLNFGAIAPALTEKVSFGSLRVGVGFKAFRK